MANTTITSTQWGRRLVQRITCPTCWHSFQPEEVLFIAKHPELLNDPVVGDEFQRFLPTRFTVRGEALDAKFSSCSQLACPRCHLPLNESLLEVPPLFTSIVGAPASGKSYFLAAMTWELRRLLPKANLSFTDADPVANGAILDYERTLFLNANPHQPTEIRKTWGDDEQLHRTVRINDMDVRLPLPLQFVVWPTSKHYNFSSPYLVGRVVVFYDNAGEAFMPGAEELNATAVQHLAKSSAIFVLFDPLQDPHFRALCASTSQDPQLHHGLRPNKGPEAVLVRQEMLLKEAAIRIRRFLGLSQRERLKKPLIVIVSKYDMMSGLDGPAINEEPYHGLDGSEPFRVDLERIEQTSNRLSEMFRQVSPEFVATADSISEMVHYIPVSSFGHSPEYVERQGGSFYGVKPASIRPQWVTVPLVYCMTRYARVILDDSRSH